MRSDYKPEREEPKVGMTLSAFLKKETIKVNQPKCESGPEPERLDDEDWRYFQYAM
jgi:hypothetical protein